MSERNYNEYAVVAANRDARIVRAEQEAMEKAEVRRCARKL